MVEREISFEPITTKINNTLTSWWRHQMEKFSALLALCAGNSPVPGEFPAQRPVTRSFDVFFDVRLNKRLCKQSWGWWFETQSGSLWRHRNVVKPRKLQHCTDLVFKHTVNSVRRSLNSTEPLAAGRPCTPHPSPKHSQRSTAIQPVCDPSNPGDLT